MTDQTATAQLPRYLQIAEMILRDVAAGRRVDGERLPPEREMAAQFSVSVGTLRKALAELEAQGILERVQGSGNYIRSAPEAAGVYSMFRLELPEGGGLPRALVISVQDMEKPADLPAFGTADRATRIRRLRSLNDTVLAVEEIWLDASAGVVDPASLSESLYRYYQQALGFWITRAEDKVHVAPVPDWAPGSFPHAPGTTVGYVERMSWAEAAQPVEYSRTWFAPDRARYVQRLR